MGLRIRDIGEKGLLGFGLAFDKIDGVIGYFPLYRLTLLAAVHFQSLRRFTSL